MLSSETFIRVRYADTDQMHFTYNGKYFEYFEVGRTELLRQLNLPYSYLESLGYLLPVLECFAKFIAPAKYDDLLRIVTTLIEVPHSIINLKYKIYNDSDGNLITEGYTKHIFMDNNTRKPIRPPKIFLDKVKPYFEKT
ncbi:MAG: acyl-CoA thioesterase [Ignavibacteria bacterium]|nr:acyl-CoA thioesterase [Ignavibacteria bacterium]